MRNYFNQRTLISTMLLSLFAVIGNYASYPLFYSVSFIFGSIAAIYAAIAMGRAPATLIAFIGSTYTIYLWGHPYAVIIFTLEVFWVATFIKRHSSHIVLIDVAYWVLLGIPLVFLFYTQLINLPYNAAILISLKQTLNGIFNTLIASFIFIGVNVIWLKTNRVSIQPLLFNIILLTALIAGAAPIILSTNKASLNYELQLQNELKIFSAQIHSSLSSLPKTNFSKLKENITSLPVYNDLSVAILNNDNKILFSRGEIKSLSNEKHSEIIISQNGFEIWLPDKKLASMKRWELGRYLLRQKIKNIPGITQLIIEKNAYNVVTNINNLKTELFLVLSLLMLFAVSCAFFLSRWIISQLMTLDTNSHNIINIIASDNINKLPQSYISEFFNLATRLNNMTEEIADNYKGLNEEKRSLAEIVDKNSELLQRLSMVASRTTNSVIIADINGRVEWVNEAFTELTQFNIEEIINLKPGEFLQGDESDAKTISRMSDRLKARKSFSEDIINYTKSGDLYWVHIDCDPIFEDDKFLGFISIETDITQRKLTEETLISRTAQLNAVLQAATEVAVITTDTNGLITMFNAGAEKMLSYKSSDLIKKESPAKFHLQSEVILRGHELSSEFGYEINGFNIFTAIPDIDGSETREWTYVKNDNTHIIVLLSVTPITYKNNVTIGYLGVAQDITERKRLDNMKKEFVSTVSHELRTPLTSISGTLGLIHGGAVGEVSKEVDEMLVVAIENSKRLTTLINDLLDMDKIASGKMDFKLELYSLMPLIEKSLQINAAYAEQYNVTFRLLSRCDTAYVNIDPDRFLQVMANFLSNASKFSHAGNTVDINVELEKDEVKISIQDYGMGIDHKFFDYIFSKFSQADSSDTRAKGGTGLGLAITKELIHYMHGTVGFNSEKGKGSVFWFKLPLLSQ